MDLLSPLTYLPGRPVEHPGPLARYLPPIPEGPVATWLNANVPLGSWVLDPFGASPRLAREAAQAGYRILVAASNPIARFLIEMAASPPQERELRAALADLAVSHKGDERLEPHLLSLYATRCANCGQEVTAEAFVWERNAAAPFARIYTCPACGDKGERPTTEEDDALAARFSTSSLHRARALERIAPINDPDREHAEEALEAYLPRALYGLVTLINKLDGLPPSSSQRRLLTPLLISAFDEGNTLWSYPTGRARPRQLTSSPRFYEFNLWKTLEKSVHEWAGLTARVPLVPWPAPPPPEGGISLFEGRIKDLVRSLPQIRFSAVVTTFPRYNQAFWTLSALWSAWLWGRATLGAFKTVLRRRRYDWAWQCAALQLAFQHLSPHLPPGSPMFNLLAEAEPGFLSAALIAARRGGFDLEGIALREEAGLAQIVWKQSTDKPEQPAQAPETLAQTAAFQLLRARGEPSPFLNVHSAALENLARSGQFGPQEITPTDSFDKTQAILQNVFSYRSGFVRYGGSQHSLEVGHWWIKDPAGAQIPLADRLETALVDFLQAHPGSSFEEIDAAMCAGFPGVLTPESELVLACLESYGECEPGVGIGWTLRPQELLPARKADMDSILALLAQVGKRLGYDVNGQTPMVWGEPEGGPAYTFFVISTAVLGGILLARSRPDGRAFIVLPGGRANLVLYKLSRDPRLEQAASGVWKFLKFRHLRSLADNPQLSRVNLDDQLDLDPLTYSKPQIPLL